MILLPGSGQPRRAGEHRESDPESEIRLRRGAQIGTDFRVALGEFFLQDGRILDRRRDDDVIALLPVHRRGDAVVVGQLQGIQGAQDFVKIAARAGRIRQDQADLLGRIDDEHRTHRRGGAGIGVDHVIERRDLAIFVSQDRILDVGLLRVIDVLDPVQVLNLI